MAAVDLPDELHYAIRVAVELGDLSVRQAWKLKDLVVFKDSEAGSCLKDIEASLKTLSATAASHKPTQRDGASSYSAAKWHEGNSAYIHSITSLQELANSALFRDYEAIFDFADLYVSKAASRGERTRKNLLQNSNFTYGEIEFASFGVVLQYITKFATPSLRERPGGMLFADLGSGVGKPCIAAALLADFATVVGYEILEDLHNLANKSAERYTELMSARMYQSIRRKDVSHALVVDEYPGIDADGWVSDVPCLASVGFFNTSFLGVGDSSSPTTGTGRLPSWVHADVVFANSTCFEDDTMDGIAEVAAHMRPGSLLVTFTRALEHDNLETIWQEVLPQSWGEATVFVTRVKGSATPVISSLSKAAEAETVASPTSHTHSPQPVTARRIELAPSGLFDIFSSVKGQRFSKPIESTSPFHRSGTTTSPRIGTTTSPRIGTSPNAAAVAHAVTPRSQQHSESPRIVAPLSSPQEDAASFTADVQSPFGEALLFAKYTHKTEAKVADALADGAMYIAEQQKRAHDSFPVQHPRPRVAKSPATGQSPPSAPTRTPAASPGVDDLASLPLSLEASPTEAEVRAQEIAEALASPQDSALFRARLKQEKRMDTQRGGAGGVESGVLGDVRATSTTLSPNSDTDLGESSLGISSSFDHVIWPRNAEDVSLSAQSSSNALPSASPATESGDTTHFRPLQQPLFVNAHITPASNSLEGGAGGSGTDSSHHNSSLRHRQDSLLDSFLDVPSVSSTSTDQMRRLRSPALQRVRAASGGITPVMETHSDSPLGDELIRRKTIRTRVSTPQSEEYEDSAGNAAASVI